MQQFDTAINTGTVDPDKAIPELMEKLKSEGAYEKVLNEMQKQYDEARKKHTNAATQRLTAYYDYMFRTKILDFYAGDIK